MHPTYRSCLFTVVLVLSVPLYANASDVNYCPCTCPSRSSSYRAPTAHFSRPSSMYTENGPYGAPAVTGSPEYSRFQDAGSNEPLAVAGSPEYSRFPDAGSKDASAASLHQSEALRIHLGPSVTPVVTPVPLSANETIRPPPVHVISPSQYENPGYLIPLVSIIQSSLENENEIRSKLKEILDFEGSTDNILTGVGNMFHHFYIPYKHHFFVMNGNGKEISEKTREWFKKYMIRVYDTRKELEETAELYRPYGMANFVNYNLKVSLFLSLLTNLKFAWFHNFKRGSSMRFGRDDARVQPALVRAKSLFRAVKETGMWKAVEVPLYPGPERWVKTDLRKNKIWKDSKAFSAAQHQSLAVYLIGPDGKVGDLPRPSSDFLREVHERIAETTPAPVKLHFPAFRVTAGTNLDKNMFPELPGNEQSGVKSVPNVLFEVKQGINICVDQHGMSSLLPFSNAMELPEDIEFAEYKFNKPFYFLFVHRQTGVPLVIANVHEFMGEEHLCRTS